MGVVLDMGVAMSLKFFIFAYLVSEKCYHSIALIWLSLVMSEIEHLFVCLRALFGFL